MLQKHISHRKKNDCNLMGRVKLKVQRVAAAPGGKIFSRTTPASTRNSFADGSRFSRLDEKLHCGLSLDDADGDGKAENG